MPSPYDVITDRILTLLEQGVTPWRRPWGGQGAHPKNLTSGKPYRGVNVFLLHSLGYESPYFVTYKQAKTRGGHVQKGEKGCPVVFWKLADKEVVEEHNGRPEQKVKHIPVLRYYTVFNVAQCEGVEAPSLPLPKRRHTPIETAERIVTSTPTAPRIVTDRRRSCYRPLDDVIEMPRPERFESGEAYYAVLFHELTHATGHPSRLDRKLAQELAPYGTPDYSREELVAEMGAAFLCGEAGISETQIEQSAAYIDGWLRTLRNDTRLVVIAAAQAQKAADYILGRRFDGSRST